MELKNLYLLIDDEKLALVKGIIQTIQSRTSEVIKGSFRFEKKGNDNLVTISIEPKYFDMLVEKLVFNNIDVMANDPETKLMVEIAKRKRQPAVTSNSWKEVKTRQPADSGVVNRTLNDAISQGNYREVISISKNISTDKDLAEIAKNNIDIAVMKAISSAVSSAGFTTGYDIKPFAERLISIASDPALKSMQKTELMKKAGLEVIKIFSTKENYLKELIAVANNNAVPNFISIKAAITFAQVTLSDKEKYKIEIAAARKNLNTRWLQVAMDVAGKEFRSSEIEILNIFIHMLNTLRS